MPAHIKPSLPGCELTIPVHRGGLRTWQGVYLCEQRNAGGACRRIASIRGQ